MNSIVGVHIATVRQYDPVTGNATVVVPALYGDAPVEARPFLSTPAETVNMPVLDPGDTVLAFYDGGNSSTILRWYLTGGHGAGSTGGGNGGVETDEVWIGTTEPTDPLTELWYDTSVTPYLLRARVGGSWEVVSPPPGEVGGGTTILNGYGPPSAALGEEGNYYLDLNSDILYGPKGAAGFGSVENSLPDTPTPDTFAVSHYALGNGYQAIVDGQIVGARFYRHGPDTITSRTIKVWSDSGTLLGTSLPSVETPGATGWIAVSFAASIPLTAGQTFAVSSNFEAFGWSSTLSTNTNPSHMVHLHARYTTIFDTYPSNVQGDINRFVDVSWQMALGSGDVWPIAMNPGAGGGVDEVWVGTIAPTDPAIELWYNPDAVPGAGPSGSYVHNQASAATTWVINHNLGFYPGVRVEDSAGSDFEGDVVHNSTNQMTLTFSEALAGKAYLS